MDAHLAYCELRILSGEREALRKEYRDWMEREPENRAVRLVQMVLLNQSVVKFRMMENFLEKNPDYARGWEELGKVYLDATRISSAVGALEKAVLLDPDRGIVRYHLGLAYRADGDREKEERELQRAMELSPEIAQVAMALGETLFYRGSVEEAAAILEPLEPKMKGDRDYHALLSRVRSAQGRTAEAEEAKRAALAGEKGGKDYLGDLVFSGLRLRNGWRLDEAERKLTTAIYLDSTFLEAYMQLGILYRMQEDADKAIETYTLATRFGSLNQLAWRNLGISHLDRGDLEEAEKYIRKSLEVDPDYLAGWVDLARLLGRMERFERAIETWNKVIAMAPYGWEAMEGREALHFLQNGEAPPPPEEQPGWTVPQLKK